MSEERTPEGQLVDTILTTAAQLTGESDDIEILAHNSTVDKTGQRALFAILSEIEDSPRSIVRNEDVFWTMHWDGLNPDGTRKYPDKPEQEEVFKVSKALARLLINEVIFLNSNWWQSTWPKKAKEQTSLSVNCNDVFAWGCADAEGAAYADLESIYRMWMKDPDSGGEIWCIIKRRQMPQRPVERSIRKRGVWDLDALQKEHNLRPNFYDGVSMVYAERKYQTYCAWEQSQNREPRPFDSGWWAGWKQYTEAHPDWEDDAWKVEDERRRSEWIVTNGYGPQFVPVEPVDVIAEARILRNLLVNHTDAMQQLENHTDDLSKSIYQRELQTTNELIRSTALKITDTLLINDEDDDD